MKPPHLPLRRGHDLWSGPGRRDLASGGCRCSSQFPKSDIWARRRFAVQAALPTAKSCFILLSYTPPLRQAAILYMEICLFAAESASARLQSCAEAAEATSEACEHCFTTTCWRMGFLPLTQRDTVRRHFRSLSEHGALGQSLLSTNWSSPLGFVYLNETLRPWGVCWGKVRNAKYLFFFFIFFLFRLSFLLFSLSPSAWWAKNPW